MRPIQIEISNAIHRKIAVIERTSPFYAPFHYHTELELIYIKDGSGIRTIGHKSEPYSSGEIVFVGSNLPHEYKHFGNPGFSNYHCIVAYFDKDVFSKEFYNLNESNKIKSLFKRAGRGIKVSGRTREIVAEKMEAIIQKKDFERILGLMEILHIISISEEVECLAYEGYNCAAIEHHVPERLTEVFNFVNTHYNDEITLEAVAKIAHLTPPAFCRLFKQKTRKSFFSYLNEVRISNACKILTESSYNVSEVAFLCGYRTLSNFNKFFKKSTSLSPKAYREKALA